MKAIPLALTCVAAACAPLRAADSLLVSASELAATVKDPSVVVLHVAENARAFEDAHVPGAVFVSYGDVAVDGPRRLGAELPPINQLESLLESAGVSDSSRVIVYGSSAVAAARVFFTLDALGVPRVALLDGGLKAWQAEGRQIETGPGRPRPRGRLSLTLDARKLVDADFILGKAGRPAPVAVIDVRPDPEFLGTDGGHGGAHAPGHIAGAQQLPWTALVAADGRFLARDTLDAKLRQAGAAPGAIVVPYCMVGMRASVVYFVARHLGYDTRLYDGSIVDWSQRGLPLKTGRP